MEKFNILKKLLVCHFFLCATFLSAQVNITNDTIYISGNQDITYATPIRFYNKSNFELPIKIKRRLISTNAQYQDNNYCWVVCYPSNVSTTPSALKVAANSSTDLFVVDFRPYIITNPNTSPPTISKRKDGETVYSYTFYDCYNPNDSMFVVVKYNIDSEDDNGDPITDTLMTIKRKSIFTNEDTMITAVDPFLNFVSSRRPKVNQAINIGNDTLYVSGNKDADYSFPLRIYNKANYTLPIKIKRKLISSTASYHESKFSWMVSYGPNIMTSMTYLNIKPNEFSDALKIDFKSNAMLDANSNPPTFSDRCNGTTIYSYTMFNMNNPWDSVTTIVKYSMNTTDQYDNIIIDTSICLKAKSSITLKDTVYNTLTPFVNIMSTVGIEKNRPSKFFIHVDQISNRIKIENQEFEKARFKIYNLSAQLIYESDLNFDSKSISTLNWPDGIYFYTISDKNDLLKNGKFILEQ